MAALRNAIFAIIVVVQGSSVLTTNGEYHPLSDEFIDMINSKQNFWRAGRNFHEDTPLSFIKNLMGVVKDENPVNLPTVKHDVEIISNLPENFDPRDKWPNCPSLKEIRDQGSCGSCWAFAAVEAMTDRYCIFSNQTKQFHFSAQDLLSCSNAGGCGGGNPATAWMHWLSNGIVSGGNYNSSEGCRPYEIPMCNHHTNSSDLPPCTETVATPECVKSCESSYNVDYEKDKRYGKSMHFVENDENDIKAELFTNGPLAVDFKVYSDFLNYKEGVYKHIHGKAVGYHAVKLLGWGVENGVKYWLIANSWNPHWGQEGYFKILRGENHCQIEGDAIGGVPLIV